MSIISELQTPGIQPPILRLPADTEYVWDFSRGADHSTICCEEPVVRIKAGSSVFSPGRSIGVPRKNARRNTLDYRDPIDKTIKRAEGSLEMKGLYQDFRDPDVIEIQPQFGPCRYRDKDGKVRDAYWDARITYSNGTKVLKDFKPAATAAKKNHVETVTQIFQQMPPEIADSAAVITDRDLPEWAVQNGRLIHTVLCDPFWVMRDEMAASIAELQTPISLESFCLPHGGIERTFRTAVFLIAKRMLWHAPGRIDASTLVGPFPETKSAEADAFCLGN